MEMQREHGKEDAGMWLPLIEYSVKTGISLSTIRRKIKSNAIPHRLEKGKYLILLGDHTASYQEPVEVKTEKEKPIPSPSTDALKMVGDAFDYIVKEKDERIRQLEKRNHELEEKLEELRLLVQVLEEKYDVEY